MPRNPNEFQPQLPLNMPVALTPIAPPDMTTPLLLSSDDASEAQLPLSHYVWLVRTHWIKMAAFIAFAVIATAMVTARLTPLYDATATLYLDRNAAKNLVGQDSQAGSANKGDIDAYVTSQIQIIKKRRSIAARRRSIQVASGTERFFRRQCAHGSKSQTVPRPVGRTNGAAASEHIPRFHYVSIARSDSVRSGSKCDREFIR